MFGFIPFKDAIENLINAVCHFQCNAFSDGNASTDVLERLTVQVCPIS